MKNSDKKIIAIVPAFNEEKNVGNVLKVLLSSKKLDEVILVDDGSDDKTAEIGQRLGAKVVRLEKNFGKGNAIKQGVKNAKAEIIVFFDADLLGLLEKHICLLIDPMRKEDIDMCIGVRERLFGLPWLLAKIDPMSAIGGERAIKRELFEKIPEKLLQGFMIEPALNYYCIKNKLRIKKVLLKNLDIITKEEKIGFAKGFMERIKMIFQIIKIRLIIKNEFQKNNDR